MKKPYMKPGISYESFELSENIAAGCGNTSANSTQGSCGVVIAGRVVFISGVVACTTTPANNGEEYFGICYYVPSSDSNVFES